MQQFRCLKVVAALLATVAVPACGGGNDSNVSGAGAGGSSSTAGQSSMGGIGADTGGVSGSSLAGANAGGGGSAGVGGETADSSVTGGTAADSSASGGATVAITSVTGGAAAAAGGTATTGIPTGGATLGATGGTSAAETTAVGGATSSATGGATASGLGGASATGGATSGATGGEPSSTGGVTASATGGEPSSTGGATASATGGATATVTGGATATGGTSSGGAGTGGAAGSSSTGTLPSDGPCSAGARRCNAGGVEICNSTGTAWLFSETCPGACVSGACAGGCTAGAKRCVSNNLEQCNTAGTDWALLEPCTTFCDQVTTSCAQAAREISGNTTLDGVVVVDGALVIHSGVTVTVSTGDLTIRATSIVIESGASIVAVPTGATADGKGTDGYVYTYSSPYLYYSGGGGGYGAAGSPGSLAGGIAWGSAVDSLVAKGSPGGKGGSSITSFPAGGLGGGVIRLIADNIQIAGLVNADGQVGQNCGGTYSCGGAGGGSGGGILVQAAISLSISGSLSAVGGAGGLKGGTTYSYNGGAGGTGRIKILYGGGYSNTGTVSGTSSVGNLPMTITSVTHPSSTLWFNDAFDQAVFTWNRPFTGLQGYYYLVNATAGTVPTPANATFITTESVTVPRSAFVQGTNYLHVVPVSATSTVGTIQSFYPVQVNTVVPTISSTSHPNQTTWSSNTSVFYSWTLPVADENVKGIHYVLDHFANTVPTISDTFVPITQKSLLLANLNSGVWFLHVVSEDTRGYLTRAAGHYQARIGTDPGVGILLGKVTMTGGTAINGATVSVSRGLYTTTTDVSGNYNLQSVIPGTWEIAATAPGYQRSVTQATVSTGAATALNITLTANE